MWVLFYVICIFVETKKNEAHFPTRASCTFYYCKLLR